MGGALGGKSRGVQGSARWLSAAVRNISAQMQPGAPDVKDIDNTHLLAEIRLHETPTVDRAGMDLDLLADQLSSIVKQLRRGSSDKGGSGPQPISDLGTSIPFADRASNRLGFSNSQQQRASNADAAKQVYAQRRRRAALFGNQELFGEPAWDILLDLYIAHAAEKPVSVSSACIGSASPPTTGLRWLGVLAENDLILREHDPEDQRRVMVRLTDRGLAAMDEYFSGTSN